MILFSCWQPGTRSHVRRQNRSWKDFQGISTLKGKYIMKTGEKMDKDRFRQGLGGLKMAYEEVLNRILGK